MRTIAPPPVFLQLHWSLRPVDGGEPVPRVVATCHGTLISGEWADGKEAFEALRAKYGTAFLVGLPSNVGR